MYVKLSIPERLKDLRVERHLTLEELAEATGLSKSALGSYEADDYKDISPFSIVTLAEYYGVSTDYLLGVSEMKNHPDTDLAGLHLSDDMMKLLASGKINNRLLCEIATHPDFKRLMVDTEICVDRIAAIRVHDMNVVLAEARKTVMEKHNPGENNLYMRTLELALVKPSTIGPNKGKYSYELKTNFLKAAPHNPSSAPFSEKLRSDFVTFSCNTQSIPAKKRHHQNSVFLENRSRRIMRCCLN